jgi:RNA polymerase sigma factor (sigma-70 family)
MGAGRGKGSGASPSHPEQTAAEQTVVERAAVEGAAVERAEPAFTEGTANQRAADLYACYFRRLVALAQARLPVRYGIVRGPDDLAQSTLKSAVLRLERGELDAGCDEQSLWNLLSTILRNKLVNTIRYERAQRRSRDRTVTPSQALPGQTDADEWGAFFESSDCRDPHWQARMAEVVVDHVRRGLEYLDPRQRQICELLMQGLSASEVARQLDVAPSTITRSLERIRRVWLQRLAREN